VASAREAGFSEVRGNSFAAEIAGLLPHRFLVRTGGFEGNHHAIPSLLSGLGGVVAIVGCVYVTSHVHTDVEGDRVARRQGSGRVSPNELDLRRAPGLSVFAPEFVVTNPVGVPLTSTLELMSMRGLTVIGTRPMLLTLKVNDLLVFVDDTGPLMITIPMASITGGAWTLIVTESVPHSSCGSQTWTEITGRYRAIRRLLPSAGIPCSDRRTCYAKRQAITGGCGDDVRGREVRARVLSGMTSGGSTR
jgi:hypothetical protein